MATEVAPPPIVIRRRADYLQPVWGLVCREHPQWNGSAARGYVTAFSFGRAIGAAQDHLDRFHRA